MHRTQTRHVTVEAHRESVRRLLAPLRTPDRIERLPLLAALGRGLAADVMAPLDLPPFANSQMDGYAIRSADVPDGGAELRVVAPVPGRCHTPRTGPRDRRPDHDRRHDAARGGRRRPDRTGPPAVFPAPGVPATVRLPAVPARNFVRDAGSDIRSGELALAAGTFLGPGQLGLLAALGFTEVPVYRALRILLVTTGDEVVEPGSPLGPGKIYDSNATLLESSMRQAGLDVTRTGISTDRPEELAALLRRHAADVDLIVTTGGVSKGAYEVVRQAMEGHDVDFLGVAMQPGGPQGIGTFDGVPVLGFPGNPVSCLVSFEMFLRPALATSSARPRRVRWSGPGWPRRWRPRRASTRCGAAPPSPTAPSGWKAAPDRTSSVPWPAPTR